ncbi:SURF1 family protein [Loktanella agnita]|uniref:SURF1 family protein n=1 Tax=Loktanella agnita TaxID=287097 RepID=UPI003987488C
MLRKIFFPLLLGIAGCAVLISLGVWQMQRLTWKSAILDDIDARITAVPVALPDSPEPEADRYLPVTLTGETVGTPLYVLISAKDLGAGYRLISPFQTGDRRIMVDLGYVPLQTLGADPVAETLTITGNLHWPDEVDSWTPAPDPSGIWFARDVPAMAAALNTEEIMLIARTVSDTSLPSTPLPVTSAGIPNDHLNYAITWFSLALVWAMMTFFLIFRVTRPKDV